MLTTPHGHLRFETLADMPGLVHVVTTRVGGVSEGLHATLNLGFGSGDAPDRVLANRRLASKEIGAEAARWVVAAQAHTATVSVVGPADAGLGAVAPDGSQLRSDGLATREPDLPLLVQSADCALILLYDAARKALAVVHAGWRGTLAGIAARAAAVLRDRFGCAPADLRAGIGPSIGPCCYSVGNDVAEAFVRERPEGAACVSRRGTVAMLDLPSMNALQLAAAGVRRSHIEIARLCTRCNPERFFSVRRDGPRTGRFGLLARLS